MWYSRSPNKAARYDKKYNLNRGYTVAVFIDLKSAYDMLSHDVLKGKLKKLGLTGEIYQYIDNFLTGRTIQVQVGDKFSKLLDINNGTPRGSVISPLLFLIMINDLPLGIRNTELTLLVDDRCVFKSGRNLDVILRHVQQSLGYML